MPEYIELETLLKQMHSLHSVPIFLRKTDEDIMFETMVDVVQQQPIAEVQEVKHGKWKVKIDHGIEAEIKCSECGFLYIEADPDEEYRHNYCPNCGAKMDKE